MRFSLVLASSLLFVDLAWSQEELTPYSTIEINGLLNTFKTTYKGRAPEEDAIAVLEDLKKAYRYVDSKKEPTKEDETNKKNIVKMIIKGLKARKRPFVTLNCVMVLGEIGAESAGRDVAKWLENVLDEKGPSPHAVEKGFLTLAWIGDKKSLSLALEYATRGKHPDMGVASWAMRACYEWRELDGKMRRELFEKILGYVGGLHSNMTGGEAKNRASYEQKYNAVKDHAMKALTELAGDGTKFADPVSAREYWKTAKKRRKWDPYVGPRFRKAAAAKKKEESGAEGG